MKFGRHILTLATLATVLLVAQASMAQARPQGQAKGPVVDTARQLRLKLSLLKQANGESLAMSINRQEWDRLTPDERDKYRREALAFLSKSPQDQEKVLKHYEQLIKLSAQKRQAYLQRAAWLQVVINSFSAEERQQLTQLPPEQRAKVLLDRKAQLIKEGKLTPDTQPATAAAE